MVRSGKSALMVELASEYLSLCPGCYCVTYTVGGKCGKCGAVKEV